MLRDAKQCRRCDILPCPLRKRETCLNRHREEKNRDRLPHRNVTISRKHKGKRHEKYSPRRNKCKTRIDRPERRKKRPQEKYAKQKQHAVTNNNSPHLPFRSKNKKQSTQKKCHIRHVYPKRRILPFLPTHKYLPHYPHRLPRKKEGKSVPRYCSYSINHAISIALERQGAEDRI